MPRQTLSLNFKALNAELHASDASVDPLLVSAKITTIKVDGKDVPAHEAPLPNKIAALGALLATGDKTVDDANLIAANGQLAGQVEKLTNDLTSVQATLAATNQKLTTAEGALAVAQASVTALTAEKANLTNLLEAGNKENARLTGELAETKTALARECLAVGCLSLAGADNKPLAADAPEAEKLSAAVKLPFTGLLTSFKGAVNAALAKTGVAFGTLPGQKPAGSSEKPELKGRARFIAAGMKQNPGPHTT